MQTENIFSNLNQDQYESLKDVLAHITVLVAGADGKIDEQELNWAEKLTHIRSYAKPEELNQFYEDVEQNFEDRVAYLIETLPSHTEERQSIIGEKLSHLNEILPCLSNPVAYQLYQSFTSFAKHIAKASGGFLRFGSISSEEKQWIDLPMVEPIILEITEEDLPETD